MDFTKIIEDLIKTGPVVALLIMAIRYGMAELKKRDEEVEKLRVDNKDLVQQLISDKEQRLEADAQTFTLLEKIMDRSGNTSTILREGLTRLEQNQGRMMEGIQELKIRTLK